MIAKFESVHWDTRTQCYISLNNLPLLFKVYLGQYLSVGMLLLKNGEGVQEIYLKGTSLKLARGRENEHVHAIFHLAKKCSNFLNISIQPMIKRYEMFVIA